jgi:hypothetical protein
MQLRQALGSGLKDLARLKRFVSGAHKGIINKHRLTPPETRASIRSTRHPSSR